MLAQDHAQVLDCLVQVALEAQRLVARVDAGARADGEAGAQRHHKLVHKFRVAEGHGGVGREVAVVQSGHGHVAQQGQRRQVPPAGVQAVQERVVDDAPVRLGEAHRVDEAAPAVQVAQVGYALDEVVHAQSSK